MTMSSQDFMADIQALARDEFVGPDNVTFKAVTQTDLMCGLRERGWKLPAPGFFISDVERVGFKTRQGYQFPGPVRRNHPRARCLSRYQTLILAK